MVKIGSGTAEIMMTLSLWWVVVDGGWWWCKVIFMSNPTFELSCGWVGVVTIWPFSRQTCLFKCKNKRGKTLNLAFEMQVSPRVCVEEPLLICWRVTAYNGNNALLRASLRFATLKVAISLFSWSAICKTWFFLLSDFILPKFSP